jgi:hypothetical protein
MMHVIFVCVCMCVCVWGGGGGWVGSAKVSHILDRVLEERNVRAKKKS